MGMLHSTLLFVPDPFRHEQVGMGLIIGRKNEKNWSLWRVGKDDLKANAVDDNGIFPETVNILDETLSEHGIDYSDIKEYLHDWQNNCQITEPFPMVEFGSYEEALRDLWGHVIGNERVPFDPMNKHGKVYSNTCMVKRAENLVPGDIIQFCDGSLSTIHSTGNRTDGYVSVYLYPNPSSSLMRCQLDDPVNVLTKGN